jgi:hypothetical protein
MAKTGLDSDGKKHHVLYRGPHAGNDDVEAESHRGSPRLIGSLVFIVILCGLQIIIAAVLAAILLDVAIAGSMREAMRYTVVDAPRQFAFVAVALVLAATAIRYTAEANIELVLPELFDTPGNIGQVARLLPRALAFLVGWSVGYPLLRLAYDQLESGHNPLGNSNTGYLALAFGGAATAIGLGVALLASLHRSGSGFSTGRSTLVLRALLALVPIAALAAIVGTALGFFDGAWPGQVTGFAQGAVARYTAGTLSANVYQILLEGLALFLCAVAVRMGTAIVISLLIPGATGASGTRGRIAALVPRTSAALVGLVAAGQILHFSTAQTATEKGWVFGIAFYYAALGLLASIVDWRAPGGQVSSTIFQRTGGRWLLAADRVATLNLACRLYLIAIPLVGLAIFFTFLDVSRLDLSQVSRAQTLGPIAVLLLWAFTATALFAPIAYLSQMTRMPLLLLLLACGVSFAGFDLNDNHQIRGASTTHSWHHQEDAAEISGYYLEHLDLGQWLKSRGDWQDYDHYPIFLVATEGGGIRAAYFTASVLAAMEQKCPGFAQHVIAISSVSGGSVGASVFAAQSAGQENMPHAGCGAAPETPGAALTRARNVLTTDLLSPLLSASLFPDALQRILPLPIPKFDRARALEYALEDGWRHANTGCAGCDRDAMSNPVATLYAQNGDAPRRPVPHLFLNTTEAGTGRSVPFATWDVGDLAIPGRAAPGDVDEALPHATLVPMQNLMRRDDVPLSTAAMLSARFPYLTPAAKLGKTGHYVDGGYFENSGTWLLSGVAQNLIGQRLDYLDGDKDIEQAVQNAVIVVVVIRSEPCTRRAENDGCDENTFHGDADSTWNEMLSPLRALLATRDKRAEYSINDLGAVTALIQRLTGAANVTAAGGQPVAPKGSMQCNEILCSMTLRFYNAPNAEVPLTWMLSSRARLSMDNAVNTILAEDLAAPPHPAPQQGDRIQGPYREILCLLEGGKNAPACPR